MIDHTGVVVSDFEASKLFYSKALSTLGYGLLMELPASVTGHYGAFVLDPDGHNIEAVCHEPA